MEDLLQREQSAEQNAHNTLKQHDVSMQAILDAFNTYRPLCEAVIFADYQNAGRAELALWQAHLAGRTVFAKQLKEMRRKHANRPVETRVMAKTYLRFLKDSEQHYRNFLNSLASASGGDTHLLAVARHVKGNSIGESQHVPIPSELLTSAYDSCYRTLCYLGDLSRYRVESELDSKPSYAHAFGYYELAVTFRPSSGVAYHQQAMVALRSKDHLNGIYSLYRSITISDPFPLAPDNLLIEVDRTNAAWDKKELIPKGPPNDPDASKRNLVGWFIRMHSMCFKGQHFSSHAELEREVFSQLANVIKQRDLERTLMRMVLIGIAAQHCAGERYKGRSRERSECYQANILQEAYANDALRDSYIFYLRSNLRMFTTLLDVFYEDLRSFLLNMDDCDIELAAKLTTVGRRLLPSLRVLSNWLMSTVKMVTGLVDEPIVHDFIPIFWTSYAKAIDLVAQAFPIWDLEDLAELTYLLEEDAVTMDFLPLTQDGPSRTRKTWYNKSTDTLKHRVSDGNVTRVLIDEEMLQRVKDFLSDGVNMANDDDGVDVPVHLRGTRIFYGEESNIAPLIIRPVQYQPAPVAPPRQAAQQKPKPISYASVAAIVPTLRQTQARPAPPPPKKAKTTKTQSRDAQLSRMVDDLVDDDEANNPATPPQQLVSNPAVVSNGEVPFAFDVGAHDLAIASPKYAQPTSVGPNVTLSPSTGCAVANAENNVSGNHQRMQSLSKIWEASGSSPSFFPSGLPAGTLNSPPMNTHSRVNSATSVRSRGSFNAPDSWDSAPRMLADNHMTYGSPLLFGLGGGPWSTSKPTHNKNVTPPNGQGG